MSILLIAPPDGLGHALAEALVRDGDEVRVLVPRDTSDAYRSLGAHVAVGDVTDLDLVERAALNAETAVRFVRGSEEPDLGLDALSHAGVTRVIVTAPRRETSIATALDESQLDHVYLVTGRRSLTRKRVSDAVMIDAISAADDLAGHPRMTVDLGSDEGWRALRLSGHP